MTKEDFINTLEEYFEETGLSEGAFNSYFSVSDQENINSTVFIDKNNDIWLTREESLIRVKTSINIDDVVEFRYSQFGSDVARFFVICNNNSGLDFCEGEVGFFENGYFGNFKDAIQWFIDNPVIT